MVTMVRDDTTNNNPDTTATTAATTSSSKVLVQAYSHARQIYWVSPIIEKVSTADEDTSGANDDDSGSNNNKHTSPWLANASSNNNLLSLATQGTAMTTSDAPFLEYPITAMQPATAAKFYPVLETLMRRGEETAAAARQFWQANPATQSVVQKTGQALQKAATAASDASDATTALQQHVTPTVHGAKDKVETWARQAEEAAPAVEQQFRQVLTMVKDEEITTLLEKAKTRLEKLVQTDLSAATRDALAQQGIRIQLDLDDDKELQSEETPNEGEISVSVSLNKSRQMALQSIQRILQQANLETADLEAVRGELTQNFTNAFDALSTAARSDRHLHQLFDTIAEKTTVWQEASGRLLQTRSASRPPWWTSVAPRCAFGSRCTGRTC